MRVYKVWFANQTETKLMAEFRTETLLEQCRTILKGQAVRDGYRLEISVQTIKEVIDE